MDNPFWCRGIRGATTVTHDDADEILAATKEMLEEILRKNDITDFETIASIQFSLTTDLTSVFPAVAARQLGMAHVPLICYPEIPVPGSLQKVVRALLHVNTQKSQKEIEHVYLREAVKLRPDLSNPQ